MSDKNKYQHEVNALIEKYINKLEQNKPNTKKILNSKKTLQLLYQDGKYPYPKAIDIKEYEQTLEKLQLELVKSQYWLQKTGKRVVVVFEGRDAAGKGGTILRFMLNLNPRYAHVVALPKPTPYEQGQWYFQRYVGKLPTSGELTFFDRSWYNRAGVEKVMGFCNEYEYRLFLEQTPIFERQLVNSGIILIKYWLSVNQLEQLRRFHKRQTSELRHWKLSDVDIESLDKWDAYTEATKNMFQYTNHPVAPWYMVRTDDKKRGRLECIKHFLSKLDYPDKNLSLVNSVDQKICFEVDSNTKPAQ